MVPLLGWNRASAVSRRIDGPQLQCLECLVRLDFQGNADSYSDQYVKVFIIFFVLPLCQRVVDLHILDVTSLDTQVAHRTICTVLQFRSSCYDREKHLRTNHTRSRK